jgi:hypothetical protein
LIKFTCNDVDDLHRELFVRTSLSNSRRMASRKADMCRFQPNLAPLFSCNLSKRFFLA